LKPYEIEKVKYIEMHLFIYFNPANHTCNFGYVKI